MLCAGDEVLRTQRGNNNAYCQDNELSWFDWRCLESQRAMLEFTRGIIAFRRRHMNLTANRFYHGTIVPARGIPDIAWHGTRLNQPPWREAGARLLAFTVAGIAADEPDLHAILNMSEEALELELPELPGRAWRLAVDTARASPDDIVAPDRQRPLSERVCVAAPRSIVVLEARDP
jgi:glycogen operon protein